MVQPLDNVRKRNDEEKEQRIVKYPVIMFCIWLEIQLLFQSNCKLHNIALLTLIYPNIAHLQSRLCSHLPLTPCFPVSFHCTRESGMSLWLWVKNPHSLVFVYPETFEGTSTIFFSYYFFSSAFSLSSTTVQLCFS